MRWLMLVAVFVGCVEHGEGGAHVCGTHARETPTTPGTIACGAAACAVGNCFACATDDGPFETLCGTPEPDARCLEIECDGPEDCGAGEECWQFENTICSAGPPAGGFVQRCHSDDDCPCPQVCGGGQCN